MSRTFVSAALVVAAALLAAPVIAQTGGAIVGTAPGKAAIAQTVKVTATITAIDPNLPSITFTGPNGWTYTSKVQDTAALAKVKVGDKVDIVWTEAMMVALDR